MAVKPLLLVEALATRNDSGLGNMARLYVDALRGLADAAEILVLLPKGGSYRPGPHCRVLEVDPRPLRPWTQTAFPLLLHKHHPAAVLCLGQHLPWFRPRARYALAIADAGPLENLGWATSSHDPYNRRWLKSNAPKADIILTISAFTRARLQALLGIDGERIKIVLPIRPPSLGSSPPGNALTAGVSGSVATGESGIGLGQAPEGEYFLSMGNVEPRKNYPGLVAAYAALKSRRPDAPPLYIVGHKAWGISEAETAIALHGLAHSVFLTDYLTDADRSAYLRGCTAYVSSSLYEGWGLPLFEALATGKPSAYHAGSSQDEFARGLALSVDCADAGALSRAMETLWWDDKERHRLMAAVATGFPIIRNHDVEGAMRAALLPLLRPPA